MTSSKRRFIIKLKILFFFCCLIVLSLTIGVNIILAAYKNSITKTLNSDFFRPVSVGNIFYLPPNIIILKNLSISESKTEPDKKILNIALSSASFSLSKLFLDKTFSIASLSGIGLIINSSDLFSFLKDNFTQILDFITGLPKNDLRLSLRKIGFIPAKNGIYLGAEGSLNLELKGQAISASGYAGKSAFSFKGLLSKGQINVENFKLGNGGINCQFWGKLSSSLAEFKGFILKDNPDAVKKTGAPKLFILDIDSRVKFAFGRVEIERLNFLLNNNPVKLTADILLTKPFTCNLKLFSDFRGMDNKNGGRLKKIALLAGIVFRGDKVIKVNGSLNMDFSEYEYKKDFLPLEKLSVNAKDLILNFEEPSALRISASALNLFSKTTANIYDINLEDLNSKVYQLGQTLKPIKFSSRFYGGRLEGRGNIEMKEFLPVISAVIRVKEVDANRLEGVLIYFSKIYGKLSSEMSFINYPQLIFQGALHLRNGSLNNFEFLKWLANLFDLPSFKKIQFNTASADFIANREGIGMSNMALDSTNVKIKGYFRLKEGDMVSSKIFLSLRRGLLRESPRFTPLLRLLDTKQELIKFNFQLSGNLHGMNFQWLKSDFKDGLQKAIPNFAKRGFEEKVDKIIKSIHSE